MEPDGSAQVAVFVDFENLVLGAVKDCPTRRTRRRTRR